MPTKSSDSKNAGFKVKPGSEPANVLETTQAVFWRNMCRKYLPTAHCNPRLVQSQLGDYIDHRYRQCCRYHAGQEIVFIDRYYGKLRAIIRNVQSCWSFFELKVEITQGRYKRQIFKIGNNISEIKPAQKAPSSQQLFVQPTENP